MKSLKYILMTILLAVTFTVTAQETYVIDSVCIGAERYYRVNGEAGSNYAWMLTDSTGTNIPLVMVAATDTTFETTDIDGNPATTAEIKISWNTPGRFTLLSIQTSAFGCDTLQQGDIKVFDQPDIYAGNDQNVCPGSSVSLNEAYGSNYSSVYWTTSGDGTFDNPALLHPVYTPGASDLLADVVTCTITAEGMGSGATCTPAISELKLNIIQLQAAVIPTDISCYGLTNGTITITGTSGASGVYDYTIDGTNWSPDTNYSNLAAGSYTVQMRDSLDLSCTATIGTVEIKEPDPLTASTDYADASCLGNDGTITVFNPQGGTGDYTFALDATGWTNDGNFSGLLPGSYVVWMSDTNNCETAIDTIIIELPLPMTASATKTDVSCFNAIDGTISVTDPQNGSGEFEFSINGSGWIKYNSSLTFNGLAAGSYVIQMRDFNQPACIEIVDTLTIEQPDQLTATVSKTDISCYGAGDGEIRFSAASGGSGAGYDFSIDGFNWQSGLSFNDLNAGSYDVYIRDAAVLSCIEYLGKIEINEPLPLTATITPTQITCYDANDGIIKITTPQNGSPAYSYKVTGLAGGNFFNWTNTTTFNNLRPDFYQIEMQDAKGCYQLLDTIEIVEPDPLIADVASTNTTCLGDDGTITITNAQNSLSGTYEFNIDGNWTANGLFIGLGPDTFVVQIRDAALVSCEQVLDTVIITAPDPLLAEAVKTDVTCYGGNNGTLTAEQSKGGSGLYEYQIDGLTGWQTDSVFSNLSQGDYTLSMRDAQAISCIYTIGIFTINEPDPLVATPVPTPVSCFGGNDGTISIPNPQGGSGAYEYSIDGTDWSTGGFDLLYAGTYTVQMRDSADHSCMIILDTVVISEPDEITANLNPADVTCYGGNDGQITITDQLNGTEPYAYSIDNGANWQAMDSFTELPARWYTIQIKDNLGCTVELDSIEIIQPDPLDFTTSVTNETAENANDGIIAISNQVGGSYSYEYSIDGTTWQASTAFVGLSPGTYDVWMSDINADSCMVSHQVVILQAGTITASYTSEDVTCYGGKNGQISFINATGTTNFEYSIDDGTTWQTAPSFLNLPVGNYTLLMRDANNKLNGSTLGTVFISQPQPLEATVSQTNESYPGASDGSVTISTPLGGSGNYEYKLDNGTWGSTTVFSNLTTGTYVVWMRDANDHDCTISYPKTLPPPGTLTATVLPSNVLCYGDNTGTLTIDEETGGSGVYEYSKDGGTTWQTDTIFNGLVAGTFNVWIRDANTPANKTNLGEFEITQPRRGLLANFNLNPPSCSGTGTAAVYGIGGTPLYDYYNVTGSTSTKINNVPVASITIVIPASERRTIRVIDANGCTSEVIINMPAFEPLVATAVVNPPLCFGVDGTVTISATGGSGSYGGTVGTFTVAGGKNYAFTVVDSKGCSSNTITDTMPASPPELVAKIAPVDALCYGDSTGSAKVVVFGGTAPFTYQWDDLASQTGSIADNLIAGTYSVTVVDANSCSTSDQITIIEPTQIIASISSFTNVQCVDDSTGTATALATGGASGYTYLWDDPKTQTTQTATGLGKGTYTVTVTDANNCTETATVTIEAHDTIPPQVDCRSITVNIDENGQYTLTNADILYIAGNSSDNCTAFDDLDLAFKPMSFDCSQVGQTVTGTLTVTDLSGNSDTCTATIIVKDTIPPVVDCTDFDLYLNNNGLGTLTLNDVLNGMSDNCGIDSAYIVPSEFTCADVGVNPGTITVIDVNGNMDSCQYNVNVIDSIPPEVACKDLEITLNASGSFTLTAGMIIDGMSDECGIDSVMLSKTKFDCTDTGDNTVTVQVTDVNGNKSSCQSKVTIVDLNLPPDAQADQGTIVQNNDLTISVLANDSDPEGQLDASSLSIVNQPAHGTVVINSDRTITYTPNNLYIGPDAYIYQVCDDGLPCGALCDTAKVTITVLPPNSAPTLTADFFTGGCNSIFGSLTYNDTDPNGDNLVINTTPVTQPAKGTVTIFDDGTFRYDFDHGQSYKDSFVYEVCDDNFYSLCSQATVHLSIVADSDCDGIPDSIDIDDDNDGIIDIVEGDGTVDTDGDGIPNSLDIDADGDGIIDNIEGQAENHYVPPSGIDDNNNGLDDIYEQGTQTGIYPVDTDGDGIPDYLDSDSDNDGVPDKTEGYDIGSKGIAEITPTGSDIDGDGLDDAYDNFFGGFDDNNLNNPYGTDPQLQDFDDDGIRDFRDPDDDNDLIPTKYEDLNNDGNWADDDIDHDGHPEYLDFQGGCDLFIPEGFSPNGDGIHDYFQIYCIDKYPDAKLLIFNRWGDKMYEQDHYGNLDYWGSFDKAWWDGSKTNGENGEKLRVGNYLYILIKGNGNMERGFVMLSY